MEALSSTKPAPNLAAHVYDQLVHTLMGLLPPPLDDSPAMLRTRDHAAIAKVASMLPVNADEADLAAQTIAAKAQAEAIMRLARANAGNVLWVIRLNAQYTSMVRTSLAAHARLMRVQAVRRKREAVEATANEDAWTRHIAEQSMLAVADPDFERPGASPESAWKAAPRAAREEAHLARTGPNPGRGADAVREPRLRSKSRFSHCGF